MFFRQIFDVGAAKPLDIFSSGSRKYKSVLKILSIIAMAAMLGIQVYVLLTHKVVLASDSQRYFELATLAVKNGVWYPSSLNVHDTYIFGNGLINLMILLIRLTGSIEAIKIVNIFCVYAILVSCIYIFKRIFGDTEIQYWFTVIFCATGTFWGEVAQARTELIFMAFAFAATALLMSGKTYACLISGVLFALANWTRPLGIVFLMAGIWLLATQRAKLKQYLCLALGAAMMVGVIGGAAYAKCGYFAYQATTGGYNLIMGASDGADGTSRFDAFGEGGAGYLSEKQKSEMTFKEKDAFYKSEAVKWIKENPGEYVKLMPKKMLVTLYSEGYSLGTFYNDATAGNGGAFYRGLLGRMTGHSDEKLSAADIIVIWTQGVYMITLLLAFACVVFLLVKRRAAKLMPFIFTVAGAIGITMLLVGGPRYHFPILPYLIMAAAILIQAIATHKEHKNEA